MIDLNLYKTFYYVAKLGSFSLAAKELGVSQPAVSYSVSELEKFIKSELFIRRGKKIELTKTGGDLLEYVDDCFNTLQLAEQKIFNSTTDNEYQFNLGVQSYLINALTNFNKYIIDNKNVRIKFIDDTAEDLIKKVENKEIECAILAGNYVGNLTCKKIKDLNMVFVSKNNISLDKNNISDYRFSLPLKTTKLRKELDRIFLDKELQINPIYEFNSNHVCLSIIDSLDAIVYIPKELVEEKLKNNEYFVLKTDFNLPSIPINIVYNEKYISNKAKEFIKSIIKNS